MRRKCERGRGNINEDGAGAEVFAGDGCSQGASFAPMAAISQRGQGGRIYNNTRTREPLRRKCVKPADLTAHFPSKICSRPRTATRPARAFSHSLPAHFRSPAPRRCTPADLTTHSPPKAVTRPRTATRPSRALLITHATPTHARRLRYAFPADRTTPSPQRHALPAALRFGHKKTAPHSACAMPNVSVDRRCGRSFGLVSRALFAAVAGRWRVGVGLRPQPWALRSRRCGRVLRA